jgi:hypothetical protein
MGKRVREVGGKFIMKRPKNQGGTDAFDKLKTVHVITHDEIHGK